MTAASAPPGMCTASTACPGRWPDEGRRALATVFFPAGVAKAREEERAVLGNGASAPPTVGERRPLSLPLSRSVARARAGPYPALPPGRKRPRATRALAWSLWPAPGGAGGGARVHETEEDEDRGAQRSNSSLSPLSARAPPRRATPPPPRHPRPGAQGQTRRLVPRSGAAARVSARARRVLPSGENETEPRGTVAPVSLCSFFDARSLFPQSDKKGASNGSWLY
jgi:hypothetical protein